MNNEKLEVENKALRDALKSIVGQTDDQFVDGVWREVNSTAKAALKATAMNDRIRLAEWMGWKHSIIGTEYCYWDKDGRMIGMCPNPFTDANDCDALIMHLSSLGWQTEIHWQFSNDERLAAGAYIHIWNRDSEIHHRTDIDIDRWKEGVSKLALKATDNE